MKTFNITVESETDITLEEMEDIIDKALNDNCLLATFNVEELEE